MKNHALIDQVARAMTAGEPPADFRARTLARLPAPSRARWPWLALPAAAAGLMWLISGTTGTTVTTGTTGTVAATVSVASASAAGSHPAQLTAPVGLPATSGPAMSAAATQVDPVAPAEPEPVFAPIVIEPIQPIAPSITPITVDPIVWDRKL